MNRQQQEVIEYLRTENRILKEFQGRNRVSLNDNQRRRLPIPGTAQDHGRVLNVSA